MSDKIEFEQVIEYIEYMGTEDHLAMFLPEERHEEFFELQIAFEKAMSRFKRTVEKWADEAYDKEQILEDIEVFIKAGVKSLAVFLQQVERLMGLSSKKQGDD